jgi:hypothetical protein
LAAGVVAPIANRLDYDAANRNGVSIRAIGRLRPGVTPEQAEAESEKVAASERAHFFISSFLKYRWRGIKETRAEENCKALAIRQPR